MYEVLDVQDDSAAESYNPMLLRILASCLLSDFLGVSQLSERPHILTTLKNSITSLRNLHI